MRQQGLSLIEMITALALSSVLMVALIVLFTNMTTTYQVDFAVSEIRDNADFAYQQLEWDLRSAGYQGCIDTDQVATRVIANDAPTTDLTGDAIAGYEVGALAWTPLPDASITALDGVAKVGSDVVTIHRVSDATQNLSNAMVSATDDIRLADNSLGFAVDDLVVITDCGASDLFQVSAVDTSGTPVLISHSAAKNSSASLSRAYSTRATVAHYFANTWYVAPNGENNTAGNPVFSLYRHDVEGNSLEVVEGINTMQLTYGEDAGGGLLRYVLASEGTLDFSAVRSVRLGVLVQSSAEARSEDDDTIYTLPGEVISPEGTPSATQTYAVDETIKQAFSTTITLRNRL